MPEAPRPASARDRLFVALDVETLDQADALMARLKGVVGGCKIGSQLFTAAGPAAVERALAHGFRVFLDLKYHDIPNTVAGAVREATRLGVFMLNVHASGGPAMLRAAAEAGRAATRPGQARPLCLGVTVLTSLDRHALAAQGVVGTVEAHVLRLAEQSRAAGLDGSVASPREIRLLRGGLGPRWIIVTPGIRPDGAAARADAGSATGSAGDDQVRVATPAAAVGAGADYLVVGRPVTGVADPGAAAAALVAEIERALDG
jgi:orotidine-5'-phosphate decarboxylase